MDVRKLKSRLCTMVRTYFHVTSFKQQTIILSPVNEVGVIFRLSHVYVSLCLYRRYFLL